MKTINRETRNEQIVRMRNEGHNLEQIGDEVGLTRERVRQILAEQGLRTMRHADQLDRAIEAWRASGEFRHPRDVANEHGLIPTVATIAALRRGCADLALPDTKVNGSRWDAEVVAQIIRRIAKEQGIDPATGWLKITEYNEWRSEGDPSTATLGANYRWSDLLTLAGFDFANAPSRGRKPGSSYKVFSNEELDAAVLEFLHSKPKALSAECLEEFLVGREDLPSLATVRNRYRKQGVGTISGIFSTALQRSE